MPKLTKRAVEAAEIKSSEYFLWDDELPGFGLRVLASGRKGYVVQYRAGRRSRRISLGPSSVLTCEQARNRAITLIAAAKNGEDPAAKRDGDRAAITVAELAERFDREHVALRLKESTAKGYRRMVERVILPALGRHRVNEVARADIAKLHHDMRHIPYDANRCLEIISKMFNLAEMWGLRPDGTNPRKHIKKYPEEKRERFLSAGELRRVGEVLREMEEEGIELPSAIASVRLLILTGCRLGESSGKTLTAVGTTTPLTPKMSSWRLRLRRSRMSATLPWESPQGTESLRHGVIGLGRVGRRHSCSTHGRFPHAAHTNGEWLQR
jgi:Arm DNA-binding domain/Phage integrase, N-terminal SAM-like domain